MSWRERLWLFSPFGRRTLAETRRQLEGSRRDVAALHARLSAQEQRLQAEKQKRRRLEQRLERLRTLGRAAGQTAPDASPDGRPLLVFDHIPKTAGTTFRRSYLVSALDRGQRWILSGGEHNERDRLQFLSLDEAQRRHIRVVAGHGADALRDALPGARFITVVRNPVDRAISSYLHAMSHDGGEALWADARRDGLTLAAFVQLYEVPDAQCRLVLGDDHAALDSAQMRNRLDARYAAVGHSEALDEFVFYLHATEGLPLCLFNNRLVRAEREAFAPGAEDQAFVRDYTATDARLHDTVRAEFRARIERLPPELRERMDRYLGVLREFRAATNGDVDRCVRLDEAVRDPVERGYFERVFGRPPAGA